MASSALPPPSATLRVQLTPSFGFDAVRGVLEHIESLGVSHLYLSPILEARSGSEHGYDVTDPTRVREELGGAAGLRRLCRSLDKRRMALILDVVPNHMAASAENPWWWDVLSRGRDSPFAEFFDIDWEAGAGRILLPVLGAPLSDILENGDLVVEERSGIAGRTPMLRYHDRLFPLNVPPADHGGVPSIRELLDEQSYRLLFWRQGAWVANYRRFFDINDLVALRVERDDVYRATHGLVLDLCRSLPVAGLRIDHVDGLADPEAYLTRLRADLGEERIILVEKILARDERLPESWPVDGTTGYESLATSSRVFVDSAGFRRLRTAARRSFRTWAFTKLARECRREALERLFPGELDRVAAEIAAVVRARGGDLSFAASRQAVLGLSAAFDAYRTYRRPGGATASVPDRRRLERAARRAGRGQGADEFGALRAVRNVIGGWKPYRDGDAAAAATRWQQLMAPVAAKGVEDTACYRHVALVSLNEVGDAPDPVEDALARFHDANVQRRDTHPRSLSATSTHDTKRSEDVRMRIHVLSELGSEWLSHRRRWRLWHAPLTKRKDGSSCPSPSDEELFYQSLLGVLPAESSDPSSVASRLSEYMVKAAREARLLTSWRDRDVEYEGGVRRFVEKLLTGEEGQRFREDAKPLARRVAFFGAVNSLSLVLLKTASPGVPDFYQGSEGWNLSLVDPDNRRPVDMRALARALTDVDRLVGDDRDDALERLLGRWEDGRVKIFATATAVRVRRASASDWVSADYVPLRAQGGKAEHVVSFARRKDRRWWVAVAPRLPAGLTSVPRFPLGGEVWGDTRIDLPDAAPRAFWDVFSEVSVRGRPPGGTLFVGDVLSRFPIALLTSEPPRNLAAAQPV